MSVSVWIKTRWKRIAKAVIGIDDKESQINLTGTFPPEFSVSIDIQGHPEPAEENDETSGLAKTPSATE